MSTYYEWVSGQRERYQPARRDIVDPDGIEVVEGELAEISHRAYLRRQQRDDLERALVLTQ